MAYLFDKPLYVRGGIASGMAMNDYADKKQKEQGLAAGLQEYLGASDEGQKDEALKNIAQYSPETAMDIYNSNRMTPYQEEMINLAKQRMANSGTGDESTNAQRNVSAMIEAGYSPQEAWAMYYGGNNPTLDMASLGKKAQEKLGSETGKNYAEDINAYNNMVSKMPELNDTVSKLNELGKNATYTTGGQLLDIIRRETGMSPRQSAVDRASYISMIDNQILPLLRDTFGAQFTEREGNTLRKTLGDANSTPEEKAAQLDAFIRQKQMSIESQKRKLDSYKPKLSDSNSTDNDPLGLR